MSPIWGTHAALQRVTTKPWPSARRWCRQMEKTQRQAGAWLPAIVCLHISCWAVTPFSTRAKPRHHVQPMQTTGARLASRQTSTLQDPCLLCDSEWIPVPSKKCSECTRWRMCLGSLIFPEHGDAPIRLGPDGHRRNHNRCLADAFAVKTPAGTDHQFADRRSSAASQKLFKFEPLSTGLSGFGGIKNQSTSGRGVGPSPQRLS